MRATQMQLLPPARETGKDVQNPEAELAGCVARTAQAMREYVAAIALEHRARRRLAGCRKKSKKSPFPTPAEPPR